MPRKIQRSALKNHISLVSLSRAHCQHVDQIKKYPIGLLVRLVVSQSNIDFIVIITPQ